MNRNLFSGKNLSRSFLFLLLTTLPFFGNSWADTISSSTSWAQGTHTVTGDLIITDGATLTVAGGSIINVTGALVVENNSTLLLQGRNNTGLVGGLWAGEGVTINAANVTVGSGSKISADSQGYQPVTAAPGNGPGGGWGANGTVSLGAGYGGRGGGSNPVGYGGTYGDQFLPTELGSAGGGCTGGGLGGPGGGAIRLNVNGLLTLNGTISANGGNGSVAWYTGGGAGGSILVQTGALTGAGYFRANGGDGPGGNGVYNGGGGGGRIAVYYGQADTFTGFAMSTVTGGTVGPIENYGEAGTVAFFDVSGDSPHVFVYHRFPLPAETTAHFNGLTVRNGGLLTIGGGSTITVTGDISVRENSQIICQGLNNTGQFGGQWAGLGVTLQATNVQIENGSTLNADGQGYQPVAEAPGNGPGGGWGAVGTIAYGAGHGGRGGGSNPPGYGGVYGDQFLPRELGSAGGGCQAGVLGGAGGGAIHLTVSGLLTLNGVISANGTNGTVAWYTGGGAGGSIQVQAALLTGTGHFSANGGNGPAGNGVPNGGGGGGRIAVYYGQADTFAGFASSTVSGGTVNMVSNYGEEGTVAFFDTSVTNHHLQVYRKFVIAPETTKRYGLLTVRNGGLLTIGGGSTITVDGAFSVRDNSQVVCQGFQNTGKVDGLWKGLGVSINAGDVSVESGSKITADSQGYQPVVAAPGHGPGAGWGTNGTVSLGAGYGGRGGGANPPGYGGIYGDPFFPIELGSAGGGCMAGGLGGAGGGAVFLNVSGQLTLDGTITANGGNGSVSWYPGGGSGGSILVNTNILSGGGYFTANGGNGPFGNGVFNGGGGGGRIAVYYFQAGGFTGTGTSTATGGTVNYPENYGQPGTVHFFNTSLFKLLEPKDPVGHGLERVYWMGLGVNPNTTSVEIWVSGKGINLSLGTGLASVGSLTWDTRTIPDGTYEIRAVFKNASQTILGEAIREVLIINAGQVAFHSGTISSNETWVAGLIHIIEGDLVIPSGVTVQVEPGAVIKCIQRVKIIIESGGTLEASGASGLPILFTSLTDDAAGGDTNLDGNRTIPTAGYWNGLTVQGTGLFLSNEFTEIRYLIAFKSGTLTASETWLGGNVYYLTGNVVVPSGMTLTILPGAVVKIGSKLALEIQTGALLDARGTTALPINVTSDRDDSIGGDTNQDGNGTSPAAGDWRWIYVNGGQAVFDYVQMRYGGGTTSGDWDQTGMIRTNGGTASVTLSNSLLREAFFDGVLAWGGPVTISNTVLTGIDRAVCAHPNSTVLVRNCTVDENRVGLLLHGGILDVANTIVSNSIDAGVLHDYGGDTITIRYSNVWSTRGTNYSGTADRTGFDGNITLDPQYKNRNTGNYRLNYQSPCIDAADGALAPATDTMGAPRYDDPRTANTGTPTAGGAYADMGAFEFVETAESDVDLAPTSLQGPSTALAGEFVTLQWTIANTGSGEVTGPWHDSLCLVREAYTNPVELFAGEALVGQGMVLGPGQTYTASTQVRVPGSRVGDHHWLVKVNSRGEVFEGNNGDNNSGISASPVTLDLPELIVNGPPLSRQFNQAGEAHWFKFDPAAGQEVLVRLNLLNDNGTTELYIGQGYMPDPAHFDFRSEEWNAADASVLASGTSTQTYYVLAYTRSLTSSPAGFTIAAGTVGFSIQYEGPSSVGNNGSVTLKLTGGQLRSDMTYEIVDCHGGVHQAAAVFFVDSALVYATFNLNGLPACGYSVQVRYQGNTAVSGTTLAVTTAPPGRIEYNLEAPRAIRPGWQGTVTIHYRNAGNTDALAPLMWVTADQATLAYLRPRCPGCSPQEHPLYKTVYNSGYFLGINHEGPAGVLPPGAGGSITIPMAPTVTSGQATFRLNTVQDPNAAVNWAEKKAALRPYYVSSEAWEAVFANFLSRVGSTIGQYNAALAENATALSHLGDYEENAAALMYFILGQCGIGEISQRHLLGAFGRGRPLSYAMWGELRNSQPVIHYANGKVREFFPDGVTAGSYTGVPGDTVRLLVNGGDGTWNLTEPDGTLFHFSPNPAAAGRLRLDFAQDLNSNRLTFGYTSGKLTSLTTDYGDISTYQYNAQGRIIQMTDPVGRVTTYTYDTFGEHLLSINTPQGTTSFTYVSGQGAAREHAVQSVAYPDGTHAFYEYDAQGCLTRTSRDGGAEAKTYAYDGAGGITVINALGAGARMSFNQYSQIGRMIGPLGAVQEYAYDTERRLTGLTGEGGIRTSMTYDEQGNRTGMISPLGAALSASFDAYRHLTGLVDPQGNRTRLEYDDHGNLLRFLHPDGSAQQFEHDGQGRTVRWINRRGQAVQYTLNTQGLLLRKEYPDGSGVDYTYDGHHNLKTVTDARGVTTFTYDGADRVTRIDSPGGRYVAYTYDASGRRAALTTHNGFRVNYIYNALGRLAGLTDGTGQLLVSYTYNPVGRLARKDLGNGTYAVYEYDAAGHLLHLVNYNPAGAVLSRFDYQYNSRGLMTRMTTLEGNWDYQYDASGQMVQVSAPGGRTIRYDYDLSGNRTRVTDNGAAVDYFANTLDQYLETGASQFQYDADGNLVSRQTPGGDWTYSYDVENRLIGISGPSLALSFEYDALGNRAAVVNNGVRREYQHDLGNLIGEYNGTGGLVAHYAHGQGLAARVDGAASRSYYHFDGSANTAQVSGAGGAVQNTYAYLPFGERLAGSETVPNPFTFVGQFGVMDDGAGLYFMRHRFYDPAQGRFVQPDPLGLAGREINLYRYGGNLPNMLIDPNGLLYGALQNEALAGVGIIMSSAPGDPNLQQNLQASQPTFNQIMANVQHLTNPDNPYAHLPFHYAQQGNVWATQAAAAALAVSMFTGPGNGNFGQHFQHFMQTSSQYSHIINPYIYSHGDNNHFHFDLTAQGQHNPAVQQALAAMEADFQNYFNQQCNNPPSPPDGPCACPVTSLLGEEKNILRSPPFPGCCSYMPPVVVVPTQVVSSYDPNVKVTAGYGNEGFITGDTPLVYTIYFENQAAATAPAQRVVVTDQLSDKLDWSTLELLSVRFNQVDLYVPAGLQHYETTASVSTDPNPVRVRAGLDANTGALTWTIQSEDSGTGQLPEDPLAGFLPPNKADCGGCGEGYVSFLVWPKGTLAAGETIPNSASIVFDENAPIVTDLVTNTIDNLAPTSSVQVLPAQSYDRFLVSWGGADNTGGSGLAFYNIYVSEDGGPFTLWLAGTTETRAMFTGRIGHTYGFYSLAVDHLGNGEAKAAVAEASTLANETRLFLPLIFKR